MRTIHIPMILGAVILSAMPLRAAAQDHASLLTSIEVRRLVAGNRPADYARLRDHFAALADKFTIDARRYRQTAQIMTGNPNHPPAISPGMHWTRLADSAERNAATLRALSAHYDRLATGRRSEAPPVSARFEAGYGAPPPTGAYVHELAADASTRVDHAILASHFASVAEAQTNAARKYDAAAQAYRGPIGRIGSDLAGYYNLMAHRSRVLAGQARADAAKQRQLAQGD